MKPKKSATCALTCLATLTGFIWYYLGFNIQRVQSPNAHFELSPASTNTEYALANLDTRIAVQQDSNDTRMIRIYGLRDEDEWTHPTHNYTYPPW